MTNVHADGIVEFRFFRPEATSVSVAGDFNCWRAGVLSMQRQGNGWWVAKAPIGPGEHRFRYFADGRWFTDYAAHRLEPMGMGWNSIIRVPEGVQCEQESELMAA